ncbi:MAG: hypothetical protein Q9172_007104 [Xanthocarpia lactea]
MSRNDTYLSLCLEQASLSSLHYRHGCVIVRGGKVIGKGYNDHRPGFNGGAKNTRQLGMKGQDPALGTPGSSLANTPLSIHSEMMAITSALSLSSAIACQGTARSTQWLQKPLAYGTSKPTPTPSIRLPKSRPPRWSAVAGPIFNSLVLKPLHLSNVQHEQVDCNNVEEEEEDAQQEAKKKKKRNASKRNNPGNNSVHHHAQIDSLKFQKANFQKALRQPTDDNNEKHRKHYLYGIPAATQYHHHSHHLKEQSSIHPQQQRHKSSALVVPQRRIVAKSHQVAERLKDSRLNGADLYVARLAKGGKSSHFDCGCERGETLAIDNKPATTVLNDDGEQQQPKDPGPSFKPKLPLTGSLHDELRFPSPSEKPSPIVKPGPTEERLTATHSRPCYRCISYMHSAGIKRVFWTNSKGEWEGGKVRELVDALEAPVPSNSDGSMAGIGAVYVTKSEVLLLKGLR